MEKYPVPLEWITLALNASDDDLRERILTGFKDGKPFTPYVPTLALPLGLGRVLDFGCGVGRNFPFLTSIARRVTGFDLPPMIARCRELAGTTAVSLADEWPDVAEEHFDLIFASLVLQHVEPHDCRAYLADFARMAPAMYILTRSDTDHGENIFDLIAATGLYRAGECVEVNHDPDTNQLRVLGRLSFDEARRAPAGGHYEVMLAPV